MKTSSISTLLIWFLEARQDYGRALQINNAVTNARECRRVSAADIERKRQRLIELSVLLDAAIPMQTVELGEPLA